MTIYPKQGDFVFMSAEPHAGQEIGGHNLTQGNIRCPFLILSRESFNSRTGLVYAMAITSKHRKSPIRERIVDIESGINGDLLLTRVPEYDFNAREGEIVGHIKDYAKLEKVLSIFKQIF